jgi:hypothetical protein
MARINNRTEEDIVEGACAPFDGREDESVVEFDDFRQKIETLSQDSGTHMKARIYRVEKPSNKKIYVGNFEGGYVYEEHVAENYGGGSFWVFYTWTNTKTGKMERSSTTMTIADDIGRPRETAPAAPNSPISNFLGNITADKVAAAVAMIEGIKKIFSPQIDFTKMFEIMATPRSPSVSDAVMVKILEGIQQNGRVERATFHQQLEDLKNLKDIAGEFSPRASAKEKGDDTMDMILKMGLPMLANLVKVNGGNMKAAGESVRGNAFVDGLIANNPAVAQKFFQAVADEYGDDKARQLAEGYGYNMSRAQVEGPAEETPAEETPAEKEEG